MKILHITPHVGGGVGAVIKSLVVNLSSKGVENHIVCLDKCRDNFEDMPGFVSKSDNAGSRFLSHRELFLNEFDFVLVHYWNHPLLVAALMDEAWSNLRVVFWCHNSGLYEPHIIPSYLVDMSCRIVFSTACSHDAPNLRKMVRSNPCKFNTVHSISDLEKFKKIGKNRDHKPSKKSRGLYCGTVSYSKMHPDSAWIFAKLSRCGFEIEVVGGPECHLFEREVNAYGGKVSVLGHLNDVTEAYEKADFFFYPLRNGHFGTGEQVLLEAMASGNFVITLDNPAERQIISDQVNGIISTSCQDFVEQACAALTDSEKFQRIVQNAMNYVSAEIDDKNVAEKFMDIFSYEAKVSEKKPNSQMPGNNFKGDILTSFIVSSFFDQTPGCVSKWSCMEKLEFIINGIEEKLKETDQTHIWLGESKGSILQYLKFFPTNPYLVAIYNQLNKSEYVENT